MTDLAAVIDIVARQMVYRAVVTTLDVGTICHEDYPNLSQSTFEQCTLRAANIARSVRPDPQGYRGALQYLARADASNAAKTAADGTT